jgi:hypothetical protein
MKLFETLTAAVGADVKGLQGDTLRVAVADAAVADDMTCPTAADIRLAVADAAVADCRDRTLRMARVAAAAAAHHRKHRGAVHRRARTHTHTYTHIHGHFLSRAFARLGTYREATRGQQ